MSESIKHLKQWANTLRSGSEAAAEALRTVAAEETVSFDTAPEITMAEASFPAEEAAAAAYPDAETLGTLVAPVVSREIGRLAMGGRYTR